MNCPKCGATSGDDWSQCGGECPWPFSPNYKPQVVHYRIEDDGLSLKVGDSDWFKVTPEVPEPLARALVLPGLGEPDGVHVPEPGDVRAFYGETEVKWTPVYEPDALRRGNGEIARDTKGTVRVR